MTDKQCDMNCSHMRKYALREAKSAVMRIQESFNTHGLAKMNPHWLKAQLERIEHLLKAVLEKEEGE